MELRTQQQTCLISSLSLLGPSPTYAFTIKNQIRIKHGQCKDLNVADRVKGCSLATSWAGHLATGGSIEVSGIIGAATL